MQAESRGAMANAANIEQLVVDLNNPAMRETALLELSKKREQFPDLAVYLWHSFGTISALLLEIVSVYPKLTPPAVLTHPCSNRVCNALALLQCVASHMETRNLFLKAQVPIFLYPFLNTREKGRPYEYLRLTSLGVIGALVKVDDSEVIKFLLSTDIIPLCFCTMEYGTELSKTVATFIIQKILLDDAGLAHVCETAGRIHFIAHVLGMVVMGLRESPSPRLLKHIIRCYLRLSDSELARKLFMDQTSGAPLPIQAFLTPEILDCLREDKDIAPRKWLVQFFINIGQQQVAQKVLQELPIGDDTL